MKKKSLLLNYTYEPIQLVDINKAIMMVLCGKAEIVNTKDNIWIRSVSVEIAYPDVIRLIRYVRIPFKHVLPPTKKNILLRDNNTCQYCGETTDLTIDHIIPTSRGGKNTWENMVTACKMCNSKKGDKTLEEVGFEIPKTKHLSKLDVVQKYSIHHKKINWKQYSFM